MATINVGLHLKVRDDISKTLINLNKKTDKTSEKLGKMGKAGKKTGGIFKNLKTSTLLVTSAIAGLGYGISKTLGGLFETASKFEKFENVLSVFEGDPTKAKKSLGWISDFAATTPFEIEELIESFTTLKKAGVDSEFIKSGLLTNIGNTASAVNKSIAEVAASVFSAVSGENERLKALGVTTRIKGDKATYSLFGKDYVVEDRNKKQDIVKTLSKMMANEFSGSMEIQSKSWAGMLSNLADSWTSFQLMIMSSGSFSFVKEELGNILSKIEEMAENGKLKEIAEKIGTVLLKTFQTFKYVASGIYNILSSPAFGAFLYIMKKLAPAILAVGAGILAIKGILGIIAIIKGISVAMGVLNVVLLANPIIAITTAVFALIAALVLYRKEIANVYTATRNQLGVIFGTREQDKYGDKAGVNRADSYRNFSDEMEAENLNRNSTATKELTETVRKSNELQKKSNELNVRMHLIYQDGKLVATNTAGENAKVTLISRRVDSGLLET